MREMYSKMAKPGGEMMLVVQGYILKYGDVPPIWWKAKPTAFMKYEGKTLATRSDIPVYIGSYDRFYNDEPDGKATVFLRKDGIYAEMRLPADKYSFDSFKDAAIGCMVKNVEWDEEHEEVTDGELLCISIQVEPLKTNIHPVEKITENKPFEEPRVWERSTVNGR